MKKRIVRLTENDLTRVIRRVIKETNESELEELLTLDLGDDFEDEEEFDLADSPWDTESVRKARRARELARRARELRNNDDYLPDEYEFEDDVYISEIKKLKKRISVMEAKLRNRRKRK